jgi:hypothetical protein
LDAENSLKVASWEIEKMGNIKAVLKRIGYEDWRWMELTEEHMKQWTVVFTVFSLEVMLSDTWIIL